MQLFEFEDEFDLVFVSQLDHALLPKRRLVDDKGDLIVRPALNDLPCPRPNAVGRIVDAELPIEP